MDRARPLSPSPNNMYGRWLPCEFLTFFFFSLLMWKPCLVFNLFLLSGIRWERTPPQKHNLPEQITCLAVQTMWVRQLHKTLQEMETMHQGVPLPECVILHKLHECAKKKDLSLSCIFHSFLVSLGIDSLGFFGDQLIQLYSKCGNLTKGYGIFCKNPHPTLYSWNAILNAHMQLEVFDKALYLFSKMSGFDVEPDKFTFLAVLKASRKCLNLEQVRLLHGYVVERGLQADIVIGSAVVDIYARFCDTDDAYKVFNGLEKKDVVTWNAMIGGFVQCGNYIFAFKLSEEMVQLGLVANEITFCHLLRACIGLESPKNFKFLTHDMIIRQGLESITSVANSIVDMYAKYGSLDVARKLFDSLACKDSVTWNAMIAGYIQSGNGCMALQLFGEMQGARATPDNYTFASSLQACGMLQALDTGKLLHSVIIEDDVEGNVVIERMLIDMYVKCGSLSDGCKIFGDLQRNDDVVSWNSLISGYTMRGDSGAAVILFEKMQRQGVHPDDVTYSWVLKAYAIEEDFTEGRISHDEIMKRGFETNKSIGSSLVVLYAMCGAIDDGRKVFDSIPDKDLVLWNALIAAYSKYGMALLSIQLYERMQIEEITPDNFTFSCVIKTCGDIKDAVTGRLIHHQVLSSDRECDLGTGNSLVDMYSKFGDMEESYTVFQTLTSRDVITWNTVISGFAQQDNSFIVLKLFSRMQEESIEPDEVTFTCVLKACGNVGAGMEGRVLHDQVLRHGLELSLNVRNQLENMYAQCVELPEGSKALGNVQRDHVQWNANLNGLILHKHGLLASDCLSNVHTEGVRAERSSYLAVLKTCSYFGAPVQGMFVHDQIIRSGCDIDIVVGSTLVDLYAKCGKMREARMLFDMLPDRDVASWNAMIAGYTCHGDYLAAKNCVEAMQDHGFMPDIRTYSSLLAVCSRSGNAEEGNNYLQSMKESFGVPPDSRHYTSMIDLLSREGKLDQAEILLKSSPFTPDVPGWRALLSACKAHGDKNLGRECYDEVVLSNPENSSGYVLMANLWADTDRLEDAQWIE